MMLGGLGNGVEWGLLSGCVHFVKTSPDVCVCVFGMGGETQGSEHAEHTVYHKAMPQAPSHL